MERLNDNEVKEIARMQQKIDSYEGFICALRMMMLSDKEINFPMFTDTNLDKEMNSIWRWIKEHRTQCYAHWHTTDEMPKEGEYIIATDKIREQNIRILCSPQKESTDWYKTKRWIYIKDLIAKQPMSETTQTKE